MTVRSHMTAIIEQILIDCLGFEDEVLAATIAQGLLDAGYSLRQEQPPEDDRLEQAERLLRLSWVICHNEGFHELERQIGAWLGPTKGDAL